MRRGSRSTRTGCRKVSKPVLMMRKIIPIRTNVQPALSALAMAVFQAEFINALAELFLKGKKIEKTVPQCRGCVLLRI